MRTTTKTSQRRLRWTLLVLLWAWAGCIFLTVDLRAERAGVGSGRVYTITITATDGQQNSSMTSLTVLVPRSKGQGGN